MSTEERELALKAKDKHIPDMTLAEMTAVLQYMREWHYNVTLVLNTIAQDVNRFID